MKFAAIDIGSNAVRLLISDIIQTEEGYKPKKNTLIRVPLRLGDDAFLDKKLSIKKVQDLEKTLLAFKNLIEVYKVKDYHACATAALRECTNGESTLASLEAKTNVKIEIIDGAKEAHLIYLSHIHEYIGKRRNFLFVDVGGGSTELSLFVEDTLMASHSFKIGTIRILDNNDKEEEWEMMKNWIRTYCSPVIGIEAIGTGGNITKLFKLTGEREGVPISYSKLKKLYQYLASFSLKDRINILGLKEDRADVILPAAEIFLAICKWSAVRQIHVPKTGLADGIIQNLMEKYLERNLFL